MEEGILLKHGLFINPIGDLKGTFMFVAEGIGFGFEGGLIEIALDILGDLILGTEVSFVEAFRLRLRTGDLPRKMIGSVERDCGVAVLDEDDTVGVKL